MLALPGAKSSPRPRLEETQKRLPAQYLALPLPSRRTPVEPQILAQFDLRCPLVKPRWPTTNLVRVHIQAHIGLADPSPQGVVANIFDFFDSNDWSSLRFRRPAAGAGESREFRRLRHAIEKAHGDRESAIRFVCRLYHVSSLDALPGSIQAATLALLDAPTSR